LHFFVDNALGTCYTLRMMNQTTQQANTERGNAMTDLTLHNLEIADELALDLYDSMTPQELTAETTDLENTLAGANALGLDCIANAAAADIVFYIANDVFDEVV